MDGRNGRRLVNISAMNTSAAVAAIVSDQIDILVDLAGCTKGNRLDVFAASPAPVQVALVSVCFRDCVGSESGCESSQCYSP
jgi:predicted O-linked N-acetylglucosamine transferase (SPINDLY family)